MIDENYVSVGGCVCVLAGVMCTSLSPGPGLMRASCATIHDELGVGLWVRWWWHSEICTREHYNVHIAALSDTHTRVHTHTHTHTWGREQRRQESHELKFTHTHAHNPNTYIVCIVSVADN